MSKRIYRGTVDDMQFDPVNRGLNIRAVINNNEPDAGREIYIDFTPDQVAELSVLSEQFQCEHKNAVVSSVSATGLEIRTCPDCRQVHMRPISSAALRWSVVGLSKGEGHFNRAHVFNTPRGADHE